MSCIDHVPVKQKPSTNKDKTEVDVEVIDGIVTDHAMTV